MSIITIILVICGLFTAGAAYFLISGRKPLLHKRIRSSEFKRFFDTFFQVGADGSVMVIRHEPSGKFLQYVKNINDIETISFGFPKAGWSLEYYETIKNALRINGFDYLISPTNGKEVKEFIDVDGLKSSEEAIRLADTALSAMGISNELFTIYFRGDMKKPSAR